MVQNFPLLGVFKDYIPLSSKWIMGWLKGIVFPSSGGKTVK
jgi:hypothetical protein